MNDTIRNTGDLLALSGGYWSACALHAGVKLDIFTLLAVRSCRGAEAAAAIGADARGTIMLLNALSALGLLEKNSDSFSTTPFSARYLSKSSPDYMGHIIMHHHFLMQSWKDLDRSVRTGAPLRGHEARNTDETEHESFLMGMFNLAMLLAPKVAEGIDLSGKRRLLDLGGGPGTYAIHFALKNPQLHAVILDLPSTRKFAEKTIARFGVADRVSFVDGDFTSEQIGESFDAVWLSHILHGEGEKECGAIVAKAFGALEPGGDIMIQEFILDDDKSGPLFPALFSLNMLLGTDSGEAYSGSELAGMLTSAGALEIRRLPVELPNGAGIIRGCKQRD